MVSQTALQEPVEDKQYRARKILSSLHNDLRDQGFSPLEAATFVAHGLTDEADDYVDASIFRELKGLVDNFDGSSSFLATMYQEFLVAEARSGLGQYLTPIPVADLISEFLSDVVPASSKIMDPFCGVGILLDRFFQARPDSSLIGLEINPGIASIAAAMVKMSNSGMDLRTLDSFKFWAINRLPAADVVVTNPPFGSIASSINGHALRLPKPLQMMKRVPAELLGLEISVDALTNGGWLGAVLPQSILTNSSWSAYRSHLFSKFTLEYVVSLPEETFAPFRGVAKACVVFGTKKVNPSITTYTVPLFRSKSVGYDDTGRPTEKEPDLALAVEYYNNEASHDWYISLEQDGNSHSMQVDNACSEERIRLGDIAKIFCGRTPPRTKYVDDGPFLLKVGNLGSSFISWSDRKRSRISLEMFKKNSRLHLRPGDICLTAAAHRPRYIGRKVNVIYDLPDCGSMPSAEVMIIRLNPDSNMKPEELLFYLRSLHGYQQIQDLVRGSTAHLYPKDVAEMFIPIESAGDMPDAVTLYRKAAQLHEEAVRTEHAAMETAGLRPNDH